MHLLRRNEIASIHDQCLNKHAGNPRGDIQTADKSANGSEHSVHGHGQRPEEQQADEELGRRSREVGHKVDHNVEDRDLDEDERDVDDGLGDGVGCWPVELEAFVLE